MRLFHPAGPSLAELVVQALSSVESGYDRLADRFDVTPFRTPDAVIDSTLDLVGELAGLHCLDLCCGTGAAAHRLHERGASVVGLDLSQRMLDVAAVNAEIEWRRGDALEPPADFDRRFDVVVSFGAFGHFEAVDHPRLIRAVRRMLRPGGRFVFATSTPPARWSKSHLIARTFNGVMRVRNALWRPPFVMYYLSFHLPRARRLLEEAGFSVVALPLGAAIEPGASRVVGLVATIGDKA